MCDGKNSEEIIFVVPGRAIPEVNIRAPEVIVWCDCLGDDFEWPPKEFRPSGW